MKDIQIMYIGMLLWQAALITSVATLAFFLIKILKNVNTLLKLKIKILKGKIDSE